MIRNIFLFGLASWFLAYLLRLLYIALRRDYVTAFKSMGDRVFVRHFRKESPRVFWANIGFALIFLPIGIFGFYDTGMKLLTSVCLASGWDCRI